MDAAERAGSGGLQKENNLAEEAATAVLFV